MANMANDGFIKFKPEAISSVAAILSNSRMDFGNTINGITKKAEVLKNNWQGDAADAFWNKIRDYAKESLEIEKSLMEFAKDLETISGVYNKSEMDAKEKSESLPVSGVFND